MCSGPIEILLTYLSSGPLTWSPSFVTLLNFLLDLIAELGVGVFVFGRHLEQGDFIELLSKTDSG